MQGNLREYSKKAVSAVKGILAKIPGGVVPIVMLLSVGIIALTQESPFQVEEFSLENEDGGEGQDVFFVYESPRAIPEWVKPARWFRSNSGGMPLQEVMSRIAAMRGEYALVIDFTTSLDLPEYLRDFYDERYFIEVRTLFKNGAEDRVQWIFRDEDYGVRLIAVLFEPEPVDGEAVTDEIKDGEDIGEDVEIALTTDDGEFVVYNDDDIEDGTDTEFYMMAEKRNDPASGFIEIYDEKYHITAEYRYTNNGEKNKIEYFYNENIKISARTLVWDDDKGAYVQTHTDYYRYNRSASLRAVERVFSMDQQITESDNIVRAVFPQNILAAAKNKLFMGERFNSYPEFFGDLFVLKDSRLVFTTDDRGRVMDQTLIRDDEENTVIWKIENTWQGDRLVKITKTEGDTVLLAEYVYNREGDRVLERNIKDGVLERVVRVEGNIDIEELYINDRVVLRAVWEDGRKISESRINKN
jgi:hypothetical protein